MIYPEIDTMTNHKVELQDELESEFAQPNTPEAKVPQALKTQSWSDLYQTTQLIA